ncbi:ABC transporter permease [Mycobacterium sp. SMC-16]|uniref:ABC transporter permease n=1 Tax=Mycobacteriaceae TaxID=1762 RepID=UPI00226AD9B8|nr:ABC transporter permease [Mycolicibacterium mucogenicum]MCX8558645.1 ABC transporter permease [Mycolicibacterium mucogenicum]
MTAVVALTERVVTRAARDLDIVFAAIAPVATFAGANLVLRHIIDTGGMSYAQYMLPAIIVQAMLFGALTTTDRAAEESSSGFSDRLRTLPISPLAPLAARILYCLIRGGVALVATIAVGYAFGFRMDGGASATLAFVAMALALTLALSLGSDALGVRARRSETSSQLLLIPQLLLLLLSTGLAPFESFPGALQPFVRYQPVSQLTETLRGFSTGNTDPVNLVISLAWCAGMLVIFGTIAIRGQRRIP